MAGFLLDGLFWGCTCMCSVQVFMCNMKTSTSRGGIYHSLPSIFEAGYLIKPDHHRLVRLPSQVNLRLCPLLAAPLWGTDVSHCARLLHLGARARSHGLRLALRAFYPTKQSPRLPECG